MTRELCTTVVFDRAGYLGCEVAPGSVPDELLALFQLSDTDAPGG